VVFGFRAPGPFVFYAVLIRNFPRVSTRLWPTSTARASPIYIYIYIYYGARARAGGTCLVAVLHAASVIGCWGHAEGAARVIVCWCASGAASVMVCL